MKKTSYLLVFSTVNDAKRAQNIAAALIREKLAACVNISLKVRSIYRWKGKLCRKSEFFMMIKTRRSLYPRLEKRLQELHPYEVPEIVAVPIERGFAPYLRWIFDTTS